MYDFYEYTDESCETYSQFRDRMLAKIRFAMEEGDWKGLPVNTGYQFKTNTQEDDAKMLRRMLKEGLVKMERRAFRKAWKLCGMSVLVLA